MKTYRSWVVPAVVTLAAAIVVIAVGTWDQSHPDDRSGGATALGVLELLGIAAFFIGVVFTGRNYRRYRRQHGHYRRRERVAMDREANLRNQAAESWSRSRSLAASLANGDTPPPLTVWGLVLHPGESVHLELTASYSRYFGYDGSYIHVNGMFFGSGSFVATGLTATAIGNRIRRDAAAANSVKRWRNHRPTNVILTDQRVVCGVDGRWQSFYYSGVSAFYPEPRSWSTVLDFHDTEPVMLTGRDAPTISAYVAWALYGPRGLRQHPAMAPLFAPSTVTPHDPSANPYQRVRKG